MTGHEGGLSPEQRTTWVTLIALMETLPPVIDAQLKTDIGVNLFEYTVIAMLSEKADRTMQMSALAAVSFGSLSRLSHTVTRLQDPGWVEKHAGTGSRRHNTVSLTDAGLEALSASAPRHLAEVRRLIFDRLTPDEVRALSRISMKLTTAAPDLAALAEIPRVVERNAGPGHHPTT